MTASTALRRRQGSLHALPTCDPRAEVPFVGSSPEVLALLERADRLARTAVPLHLSGESGTGKEVLARRIHERSPRAGRPFEALNCAALPEALVESELFGHLRGAFTGADRDRDGVFQRADGGTLLLDEIGEMPLAMQAKLLRVLEDGRVRPVGSAAERQVDVRVLSATNRDLEELVAAGRFREDLYYRLRGASLCLPPLRERNRGVEELAGHFLDELNRDHGTQKRFAPGLVERLAGHEWPGNVRQLRNRVALLFHLCDGEAIEELESEAAPAAPPAAGGERAGLLRRLAPLVELEKEALRLALAENGGNREASARRLGISRSSLYEKIRRFGL